MIFVAIFTKYCGYENYSRVDSRLILKLLYCVYIFKNISIYFVKYFLFIFTNLHTQQILIVSCCKKIIERLPNIWEQMFLISSNRKYIRINLLMTVETEANWDLWSTNERGLYLVGSLGSLCQHKIFYHALAALSPV